MPLVAPTNRPSGALLGAFDSTLENYLEALVCSCIKRSERNIPNGGIFNSQLNTTGW